MGSVIGYQEAHGPAATFETDVAGKIKNLVVDIEPIQSGTGDPSPDNIRPITGWTGAKINVNSNVIDITLPSAAGTVYGGTLDVVKGELVVDRAMVDLGTLTWTYDQNVFRFSATLLLAPNITDGIRTRGICEIYKADQSVYSGSGRVFSAFCFGVTGVFVRDSRFDNVSDFKSAMSGVQLCYELATPITYQLTPQEINTIIGTNTIYADTGDMSVIYPKTITPIETVSNVNLMELRRGIIASQPHLETKSGDMVLFNTNIGVKAKNLIVDINPVQSGTGDPSPDNIRPITGWTGAKVNVNSNVIDIAFPSEAGTVYGGTLNASTGDLTVTDFVYTFDGTENIKKSSAALNGYYIQLYRASRPHNWPEMADYNYINQSTKELSSMFTITYDVDEYLEGYGFAYFDSGINFSCDPEIFGNTVTAVKTKLADLYSAGTPVSFYLRILNQIVYHLSPQQISLIKGANNVFTDCGDTMITYWTN